MSGHTAAVTCLAASPVRHCLCLGFPPPSRLRHCIFLACFHCLRGQDTAFALGFHYTFAAETLPLPCGRQVAALLASGGKDKKVIAWDARAGSRGAPLGRVVALLEYGFQ